MGEAKDVPAPLRHSCPFSDKEVAANLPYDFRKAVYLEVQSTEEPLYSYLIRFISKAVSGASSIRADMGKGRGAGLEDDDIDDLLILVKGKGKASGSRKRKREVQMPSAHIGLGWHSFDFKHEETTVKVTALLQRVGHPTGEAPVMWSSLVLFIEGNDQKPLLKLCQQATESETKQRENRVSLWRFDTKHQFWSRISRRIARSLGSIVLEEGVKKPLLDDLEWFLKDTTRTFYAKHGIPYHRCYLLHGEPGTGKTSFMNSLAGHIQRNLCFIQMDKGMTDDTFRNAMTNLPALSMVVMEDVDALFTNHREADHNNSSLSFSGFLNCLDGLGAPDDVVICMTTNHPEKLDPAIMRPGRIDVKAEFKKPSKDIAAKYFLTFYPDADEHAKTFGAAVGGRITERKVSMAQLQHFFLACHRQEFQADKAAAHIKDFVFDDHKASYSSTYG